MQLLTRDARSMHAGPGALVLLGPDRRYRRHSRSIDPYNHQCLKWSKKEAGSPPQSEVEFLLRRTFFYLKMVSFGAF